MAKKIAGLERLLVQELQDLFDAEKQLVKALPVMAKSASDSELENALREHLEVTRGQVTRLEECFRSMDMPARSRPCKGMKGIVEEGREVMQEDLEEGIMDSAIDASCRRVEHYEIAAYESVRSIAQQIGLRDVAQKLEETLREEKEADQKLVQIGKRLVKEASRAQAAPPMEGRRQPARGGRETGRKTAARSRGGAQARTAGRSATRLGRLERVLTDPEEIRMWAEERGARPATVRGTGGAHDIGMLRLDFPGYTGEESLQSVSWDDWQRKFEERNLALIIQDKTARGQRSNFNKIVNRETVQERTQRRPKVRAAH